MRRPNISSAFFISGGRAAISRRVAQSGMRRPPCRTGSCCFRTAWVFRKTVNKRCVGAGLPPSKEWPKPQATTGLIYARGLGCKQDYGEARRWYLRAAEQGNAAAELGLGVLYANGHGVAIDLAAAASWYEKAAEKGNDGAQMALALMYLSGQGVERDEEKGRKLVRKGRCAGQCARAVQPRIAYFAGRQRVGKGVRR